MGSGCWGFGICPLTAAQELTQLTEELEMELEEPDGKGCMLHVGLLQLLTSFYAGEFSVKFLSDSNESRLAHH